LPESVNYQMKDVEPDNFFTLIRDEPKFVIAKHSVIIKLIANR
jgi:hypothetical protein